MHNQTPLRLTAIIRSNDASDHSAVFFPDASICHPAIPALLNAQSSRPYAATTDFTIPSTTRASVTSPVSVIAWPPALLISATVSCAVVSDASATATRAPSRAKASAVARPMPPPPPVIRADLPSNSPAISTSLVGFLPLTPQQG